MAGLKSVDKVKPWFKTTKRFERSLVVTCMLEAVDARTNNYDYGIGIDAKGEGQGEGQVEMIRRAKMTDVDYWRGHDATTKHVSNSGERRKQQKKCRILK